MIPIKKITLYKLRMQMKNPFQTSFGTLQNKELFIIEIEDGEDNRGYGESVAFTEPWYTEETVATTEHMLIDFLIPLLTKNPINHPHEVTKRFSVIRRNNMAKASIEGAVWDLYAKRENISLSEALGGSQQTIDVGISLGIAPTIEELLNRVQEKLDAGYKRVKLKIKPGFDIEPLTEVRNKFPHAQLMADANSAYTLDDLTHLKRLDALNLMMIEQPLGHDDIVDHALLQQAIHTPICLDESINSFEDARKAIELGSCKVINIKIGRVGGLTEAKRIHDYCAERGITVWCGGMLEAGVGRAHNIALTSLPNFTVPGDTAASALYWDQDIIKPEVTVDNGQITVPTGAGIGFDIDHEAMEKFTVDQKVFEF
uniref:o-succinylbenzoate synthase n=1 Tax=uncultured Allobacillus sp. TaxID=1638025 RepID=UPI002597DE43|nr:o-succinylbenzoate synthase [uncultured Allobacillus sp.]